MIRVVNVRTFQAREGETAYYCGRGPAPAGMRHAHLGNPYRVGEGYAQGEAAAAFLPYLRGKCSQDTPERRMVLHLARRLAAGERVALACWCEPRPCHAHEILKAVKGYARRLGWAG